MNITRVTCPSCGGKLDVPDNRTVSRCTYCGTEIILEQGRDQQEQKDIAHYSELCKVAIEAKNFEEAQRYCNRVLELDPKNVSAWLDKAVISCFWSARSKDITGSYILELTEWRTRLKEALSYVERARSLEPASEQVIKTYQDIISRQKEVCKVHIMAFEAIPQPHPPLLKNFLNGQAQIAMGLSLTVLELCPNDMEMLANIDLLHNALPEIDWVNWDERISAHLETIGKLNEKKGAIEKLPRLKEELVKAKEALSKVSKQKGLFNKGRIRASEQQVLALETEIAHLEKVIDT